MKIRIYFSQLLMVMILLGESTAAISPKLGQFLPEIAPQRSQLVVTENSENASDCDNDEEQVDCGTIQSYHLVQ